MSDIYCYKRFWGFKMEKEEFLKIRLHLGKTQKEIANLLGISARSVESFEQGKRSIPVHIERQILFLLANFI